MGSQCSTVRDEQGEWVEEGVKQVATTAEEIKDGAREVAETVGEKVAEAAQEVKEAVVGSTDDSAKVDESKKDAPEAAPEAVAAAEAEVKQEEAKEEVAKKDEPTTAEVVQDKVNEVVADVKDSAAAATEAVTSTMEAAAAAVTGTMIVEFEVSKGKTQTVDFKSKEIGFETGPTAGCCVPAGKAKLTVTKVDKNKQAEKLGVKKNWVVRKVNGSEATSIESGKKLLAEAINKLPDQA